MTGGIHWRSRPVTVFNPKRGTIMKKSILISGILLLTGLLATGDALAQSKRQGECQMNANNRTYDTSTIATVSGTVQRVDKVQSTKGPCEGIHLSFVDESGDSLTVHLGPSWFIENQDAQIAEGDEITVTGSKVTMEGAAALIAAKVARGEEVLTLRDEMGRPVWRGWKRGRAGSN